MVIRKTIWELCLIGRVCLLQNTSFLVRLSEMGAKVFVGCLGLWVALGAMSSESGAQSAFKFEEKPSLKTKLEPLNDRSESFFKRSVTTLQHAYVSSNTEFFRQGASPSVTNFDMRLFTDPEKSGGGGVDIEARYNGGEEALYFRPFEFYGTFRLSSKDTLFVGRKKLPWSRSDQMWKRGLFEPRFMDDALEAKRAGLLGVFFVRNQGRGQFVAFASPFYVPEFGPETGIENDRFVSRNPWFRPPPDRLELENGIANIRFRLNTPSTESVVVNGGGGFGYKYQTKKNVFVETNYMYKPMNQLSMGFPFVLNLGNEGEASAVELEITPWVSYHHIASATVGKSFSEGSTLYAEVIQEQPDVETPPPSWISKQVGDATILNLTYEKEFSRTQDHFRKVWLSYSKLSGGDLPDFGNFAGEISLFENRFMYNESVQLGWQGTVLAIRSFALRGIHRAIYDFKQRGYVLSTEWNLNYRKNWTGLLKAEFLGNTDLNGEVQYGFTSQYRANDRISAGLRYVF